MRELASVLLLFGAIALLAPASLLLLPSERVSAPPPGPTSVAPVSPGPQAGHAAGGAGRAPAANSPSAPPVEPVRRVNGAATGGATRASTVGSPSVRLIRRGPTPAARGDLGAGPAPGTAPSGRDLAPLEAEVARLAEELLDVGDLPALEPQPGESEPATEARARRIRDRQLSDRLLLNQRLAGIYDGTVYPWGFPVEDLVEAQERSVLSRRDAAWREEALRAVLSEGPPPNPEPRFHPPESGRIWPGAELPAGS